MADSNVSIRSASGTATVDTRTIDGDHRQVFVLGDGSAANTAAVTDAQALRVSLGEATAATRTRVTAATTDTLLLAGNAARKLAVSVYNDSTATLYLAEGAAAASTTSFTVALPAKGYYETSAGFTGEIRGIWDSANGAAQITERT